MQMSDHDVFHRIRVAAQRAERLRRAPQVLAPALSAHRRGKAGIDDDLTPLPADQPDEVVERHRAVVRVAADEVLRPAARVMRVLKGVNLVGHLTVMRANLRLPTCAMTVRPAGTLRLLSETRSPSSLTPPCSIMRCASVVLGVRLACFNNCAMRMPPSGALSVTSGTSEGSSPSRKRLANSASARSAALAPWKRATISLAKRAFTSRGCSLFHLRISAAGAKDRSSM